MNEKQKKPEVVCIMNPDDIYLMKGTSHDLSCCISPYEVANMISDGYKFPSVQENVIFMQNPIDFHEYIFRTKETDRDAAIKRINAIEVIVSLLGGKSFNILSEIERNSTDKSKVDVVVDTSFFSANVNVDNGSETKSTKKIKVYAEWGGIFTQENYYKAEAIAKQYGLINDDLIKGLLTQRNPNNPNYIKKKIYEIDICKDMTKNLKVAADLKSSIGEFFNIDVDVNVEKLQEANFSDTFKFEAEFGPVVPEISAPNPTQKRWIWWVIGGIVVAGIAVGLLLI